MSGPQTADERRATIRRGVASALVVGLCVAAVTAIGGVVSGDFGESDWRMIATSLGFAGFSATAASGASLRLRESPRLRGLGTATTALSAASFVLLVAALWVEVEGAWRAFGCVGLAALAGSHASLVGGAMRSADGGGVRLLARSSIALGLVDSAIGILAVTGAVDDVDERIGELVAVLVILLLLTTALPPILRRLQRPTARGAPLSLAAEVLAAADRIEALNADPGNRAPEIHRECERLRAVVRMHSG